MYCSNCRMIVEDNKICPACGNKKLRQPEPGDICFLAETEPIPAGMLKDILEQNHIPVLSSSSIGAGMAMRAGSMFERIKCYVRYDHLPKAREIAEELFSSAEETQP